MEKDIVFTIKELACAYEQGKIVLNVDALRLPKGKLTFIVGVSGGGKSTLLETLGMMNNTIHMSSATDAVQFQTGAGEKVQLAEYWKESDETLSTLRRQNFSFIFQQTNLMPNFSAGENMLVTALLGGAAADQAELQVRTLMRQIGLPARAYEAPIQNLSGGQRQRLAFIRALVSEFEVLFGDEPTGNLDHKTAHDCFTLLRDYLHTNGKSGIIVSHDLSMAIKFADLIVPITISKEKVAGESAPPGEVLPEHILYKKDKNLLYRENGDLVEAPLAFLENLLFNTSIDAK